VPEVRGMGRGLAAILDRDARAGGSLRQVPVDAIRPNPLQPRRHFDPDALAELAESIRTHGVLQPLVVRTVENGYELVAGERRLRAAKLAGLATVPALVRDFEGSERLEVALTENLARADLSPVESARALALLVEDLGCPKAEVARRVGRSRSSVANLIRLLELPDEVLAMIDRGDLSEGHGRALLMCKDEDLRILLARRARDEGWSVRRTEEAVRSALASDEGNGAAQTNGALVRTRRTNSAEAADLADRVEGALARSIGLPVRVRVSARGRLTLELPSPEAAVLLCERLEALAGTSGLAHQGALRAA
jgi:ParB family chromosome partitioning protein